MGCGLLNPVLDDTFTAMQPMIVLHSYKQPKATDSHSTCCQLKALWTCAGVCLPIFEGKRGTRGFTHSPQVSRWRGLPGGGVLAPLLLPLLLPEGE